MATSHVSINKVPVGVLTPECFVGAEDLMINWLSKHWMPKEIVETIVHYLAYPQRRTFINRQLKVHYCKSLMLSHPAPIAGRYNPGLDIGPEAHRPFAFGPFPPLHMYMEKDLAYQCRLKYFGATKGYRIVHEDADMPMLASYRAIKDD